MIWLLFFPLFTFAAVVMDQVSSPERTQYSFSEVCSKMVTHESPLIEIISGTELDCMGKKVSAGAFCEIVSAQDPYYLRGYVDRDTQQVICQSGKKVIFKYQCVRLKDRELCSGNARGNCAQIKEKLAKRLDLVHASHTSNSKGIKELNCYFESLPLKEKPIGL